MNMNRTTVSLPEVMEVSLFDLSSWIGYISLSNNSNKNEPQNFEVLLINPKSLERGIPEDDGCLDIATNFTGRMIFNSLSKSKSNFLQYNSNIQYNVGFALYQYETVDALPAYGLLYCWQDSANLSSYLHLQEVKCKEGSVLSFINPDDVDIVSLIKVLFPASQNILKKTDLYCFVLDQYINTPNHTDIWEVGFNKDKKKAFIRIKVLGLCFFVIVEIKEGQFKLKSVEIVNSFCLESKKYLSVDIFQSILNLELFEDNLKQVIKVSRGISW